MCTVVQLQHLILTINKAISLRLDGIESKLETVLQRLRVLEDRVDTLLNLSKQNSSFMSNSSRRGSVVSVCICVYIREIEEWVYVCVFN